MTQVEITNPATGEAVSLTVVGTELIVYKNGEPEAVNDHFPDAGSACVMAASISAALVNHWLHDKEESHAR